MDIHFSRSGRVVHIYFSAGGCGNFNASSEVIEALDRTGNFHQEGKGYIVVVSDAMRLT
jgi:hypothetical protein